MSRIILPPDSELNQTFRTLAAEKRLVFFAGLPGTGKSLLLQQMALIASEAGRTVHLLQYDVARPPFETPHYLRKYPEVDGFTHAAIRKAVGIWARSAVWQWHRRFSDASHILLAEVPLVGNRLIELAQRRHDEVEGLLSGGRTTFLLPVPSPQVRRFIESARDESTRQPRHEREKQDAQPNVLRAMWREIAQVGYNLGLTKLEPAEEPAYDPDLYTAVYRHLLQHRRLQLLPITTVLHPAGSAYDLTIGGTELSATPEEATQIIDQVERQFTPESLTAAVENWYQMTGDDAGPDFAERR